MRPGTPTPQSTRGLNMQANHDTKWMRRRSAIRPLCFAVAVALEVHASAQPRRDGDVVSTRARPALPPFESLDNFGHGYFTRATYEEARAQTEFDVLDIQYSSDGLDVPGVLVRPRSPGNRKWPAIIYNRGGTGDYGRITNDGAACNRDHTACFTIVDLYLLAKAGFVVIASDYRFHGPTGKRDEWGGVDVNDVLNLVPAVRSLPFVDGNRLYMMGNSRGGMMTYLALKQGAPVKAAAVIAGPSDLETYPPGAGFVNGDETYDGFIKVWPQYEARVHEYYRDRSAVYWAEQVAVPILILHSRTDPLVPVGNALRMAAALQEKGKVYALHIYERDGHSLPLNRDDRNRQIVEWFNQAER